MHYSPGIIWVSSKSARSRIVGAFKRRLNRIKRKTIRDEAQTIDFLPETVHVKTEKVLPRGHFRTRENHQSARRFTHRQKANQFPKEQKEKNGKGGEHWRWPRCK